MVEVKANLAITSVTVTMTEYEASVLKKFLQETVLHDEGTTMGKLAGDITDSLDALEIEASRVAFRYNGAIGMFQQEPAK